jgi:hypothetical protein
MTVTHAFWIGFAVAFVVVNIMWVAGIMWFGRQFGG